MTSPDPRFSSLLPTLQTQVNSSSLGPFKQCPRRYYYEIVRGLRTRERQIDLEFGTLFHTFTEHYDRLRLGGEPHSHALESTIELALRATWNSELHRPMVFDHSQKNRMGLIRTLVWYLDRYGENDLELLILPDGSPALELSFAFDSGYASQETGEPIQFIGKLDKLVRLNDKIYILDRKTTRSGLGTRYFERYSPDNQFSLYSLAGRIICSLEVQGLIADAVQVGMDFSRFERALVPRPLEILEEWLFEATSWWLPFMDRCASEGYWPQNDKSCGLYGGCPFREVCSMRPGARETWLERSFVVKGSGSDGLLEDKAA